MKKKGIILNYTLSKSITYFPTPRDMVYSISLSAGNYLCAAMRVVISAR